MVGTRRLALLTSTVSKSTYQAIQHLTGYPGLPKSVVIRHSRHQERNGCGTRSDATPCASVSYFPPDTSWDNEWVRVEARPASFLPRPQTPTDLSSVKASPRSPPRSTKTPSIAPSTSSPPTPPSTSPCLSCPNPRSRFAAQATLGLNRQRQPRH